MLDHGSFPAKAARCKLRKRGVRSREELTSSSNLHEHIYMASCLCVSYDGEQDLMTD